VAGRQEIADKGDGVARDVFSALVNLGYKANLAEKAVERVKGVNTGATFEALLKEALKILAKG